MRPLIPFALALTLLSGAAISRADENAPPAGRSKVGWYAGWAAVFAGGAVSLIGTGLTTQSSSEAAPGSGLSSLQTTGWVLAGVGAAMWIAGAVMVRFVEKPEAPPRAGLDLRAGVVRF